VRFTTHACRLGANALALGTAAIICPVDRIGYMGEDIMVPAGHSGIGDVAKGFLREIQGRQMGTIPSEWSVVVSE
jgi:branched-chain amino acid aminotransferase